MICGKTREARPSEVAKGLKTCGRKCSGVATRGPRHSFEAAFWAKVDKSGECWIWTASLTEDGYGRVGVGSSLKLAHRVSWEMANGPIPEGLNVRHRCPGGPNRACVRPDHLRVGTVQDNMDDRTADGNNRGRGLPGEGNGMAKLTANQVTEIRRLAAEGSTRQVLAEQFGIHRNQVSRIIRRERWGHVE